MNISDFTVQVARKEGGRKEVNIAQIKEVLKVTNNLLGEKLYKIIRSTDVEALRR